MTYARYANRTAQTVTAGSGVPSSCLSIDTATNRVTGTCQSSSGFSSDLSGNMTGDGYNTPVGACPERSRRNGEGRAASATNGGASGTYTYDGNGMRVKKVSGSTTTVYAFSGSKVVAEYVNGAAPTAPTREYIYSGATLLAKIDAGATKYYHQDHLSNRLVTDSSGNAAAQMGSYPYGESWYNASSDKLLFTTYERDPESGNDYAMARYYVSRLGRFSSPDPLPGSVSDPQSLNRYAYVLNNPGGLEDPSGMGPCDSTLIETRRHNQQNLFGAPGRGLFDNEEETDFASPDPPIDCFLPGGGGGGGSNSFIGPDLPPGWWQPPEEDPGFTGEWGDLGFTPIGPHRITPGGMGGGVSSGGAGGTIQAAQAQAAHMLTGNDDCAKWFNTSAWAGLGGVSASEILGLMQIQEASNPMSGVIFQGGHAVYPKVAETLTIPQGSGPFSVITIYKGGSFYTPTYPVANSGKTVTAAAGGYPGGTPGAQLTILLHEFAHAMGLIPPDTGGEDSTGNTDKLLQHCAKAIAVALGAGAAVPSH